MNELSYRLKIHYITEEFLPVIIYQKLKGVGGFLICSLRTMSEHMLKIMYDCSDVSLSLTPNDATNMSQERLKYLIKNEFYLTHYIRSISLL